VIERGMAVPAEDGGVIGCARRKMTLVGQSWVERPVCWAESNGPKGRQGRFQWETEENGGRPHEGLGRNQRIKKMDCINGFLIYFKDLGFESKDSNTFKPNLN
jgi:hypothetical protein